MILASFRTFPRRYCLVMLLLAGLGVTAAAPMPPRSPAPYAPPQPVATLNDWPMFRGDAVRSARGQGAFASLRPQWHVPTVRERKVNQWLQDALVEQEKAGHALVPAFHPIIVHERLVYRAQSGVSCADLRTGNLLWRIGSNWTAEGLMKAADRWAASDFLARRTPESRSRVHCVRERQYRDTHDGQGARLCG